MRTMQRYLTQLLADLEMAARSAPVASAYRFRHPFDDIEGNDAPAYQSRFVRLCDLFGLSPGVFPPSERLTKEQLTALLTAIEALWRAWNIAWECPPRLTARRRYTIMVERMEQDAIHYNHEFGATVDFCDRRAEGQCPFADHSQCWCEELEACAKHDLEIWENARELDELDDFNPGSITPVEEFRRWLEDDYDEARFPWEEDEERERWRAFIPNDETEGWLFFFDPARNREMTDEAPDPSPEDFDDFEWHDIPDLPF